LRELVWCPLEDSEPVGTSTPIPVLPTGGLGAGLRPHRVEEAERSFFAACFFLPVRAPAAPAMLKLSSKLGSPPPFGTAHSQALSSDRCQSDNPICRLYRVIGSCDTAPLPCEAVSMGQIPYNACVSGIVKSSVALHRQPPTLFHIQDWDKTTTQQLPLNSPPSPPTPRPPREGFLRHVVYRTLANLFRVPFLDRKRDRYSFPSSPMRPWAPEINPPCPTSSPEFKKLSPDLTTPRLLLRRLVRRAPPLSRPFDFPYSLVLLTHRRSLKPLLRKNYSWSNV